MVVESMTKSIPKMKNGNTFDSKFVMFPGGHSRNTTADLKNILNHKFTLLGRLALNEDELKNKLNNLNNLENLKNADLQKLYECKIRETKVSVDDNTF
jgi:2-methylcitrate dehydratase